MRSAIRLGIFDGGGIGFEIHMAMKMLRYKDALALILFTILLTSLFEKISDFLHSQILSDQNLLNKQTVIDGTFFSTKV